jgi:hypothetical protein
MTALLTGERAMRILGSVVEEESGRPLEGLLVRAFDKDLIRDDHLGDTHTNAAGEFEISYSEVQFRDLNETLPDLYLRIFDAGGTRKNFGDGSWPTGQRERTQEKNEDRSAR